MKTMSMTKFDYLYLGALVVEIFTVIAGWDWITLSLHEAVWAAGGGSDLQLFVSDMAPYLIAASLAFSFGLWALISVFRIGALRYVLALFVAYNLISLATELMTPSPNQYTTSTVILMFNLSSVLSMAMNVAAVYFVFRADAGAWLRREV